MFEYAKIEGVRLSVDFARDNMTVFVSGTKYRVFSFQSSKTNLQYFVDSVEHHNNNGSDLVTIQGWSLDSYFGLPAKTLLIIEDNTIVKICKQMIFRPDVASGFNTFVDDTGFNITFVRKDNKDYKLVLIGQSSDYVAHDLNEHINHS